MDNLFIWIVIIAVLGIMINFLRRASDNDSGNRTSRTPSHDPKYSSVEQQISAELDNELAQSEVKKPDVISIVGGFYRSWEAKRCIKALYACETVFLQPEPDNPYDHNAIMVLSKNGLHIGYVSRYYISRVKDKMKAGPVKGSVYEIPDDRYEYQIMLEDMPDDEEFNQALSLYNEHKKHEEDAQKLDRLRAKVDFYGVLSMARDYVPKKKYASIYKMLKPIFDLGVENTECYELIIGCYHYFADYESELQYIDKYIETGKVRDRDFLNRRKYQVLRLVGHLVSNDQIENEKAGVETTILELDYFNRIVSLLSDTVDPNRIDFRDSKSLFAINLDGNIRRPICKLYLNNPDKMFIGLINEDGSVLKTPITDIAELDEIKDDLLMPIRKFLNA